MRKKTHEEFIEEVNKINPTISILGKYNGGRKKIECECNICGHKWMPYAEDIISGHRCPSCAHESRKLKLTKTHESFVKRMSEINPKIAFLTDYVNAKEKVKCKCKACEHEWNATPAKLLIGRGCPECAKVQRGLKYRKSHNDFVIDLQNVNPNIVLLSKYEKSSEAVKVKCRVCGYEWNAKPGNLLSGKGCKKCAHKKIGYNSRITHDDFLERLKKVNDDVEVLSKYATYSSKIECKCKLCGKRYTTTPDSLLAGKKCPNCGKYVSNGEKKILRFLDKNNINYIHDYRDHELRGVGNNPLSYDFFLPDYKTLIEYQGQQHHHPVEIFGGEKQYQIQLVHDSKKRDFAKLKGYQLLEIWYFEYRDIENVLKQKLNIKEAV